MDLQWHMVSHSSMACFEDNTEWTWANDTETQAHSPYISQNREKLRDRAENWKRDRLIRGYYFFWAKQPDNIKLNTIKYITEETSYNSRVIIKITKYIYWKFLREVKIYTAYKTMSSKTHLTNKMTVLKDIISTIYLVTITAFRFTECWASSGVISIKTKIYMKVILMENIMLNTKKIGPSSNKNITHSTWKCTSEK